MKTYLINPFDQTVTDFDLSPKNGHRTLDAMRVAIGCQWIDIVGLGHDRTGQRVDLVIDDEGRFAEDQRCFRIGETLLVAGRALVVGTDYEGDACSCGISMDDIATQVRWLAPDTDYTPEPMIITAF